MQNENWRALTPARKVGLTLLDQHFHSKPAFAVPDGSTLQFWSGPGPNALSIVHECRGGGMVVYAPITASGHIDDILDELKRRRG